MTDGEPDCGLTIREAINEGAAVLESSVETPFLDAVLLLGHVAGLTKEAIFSGYPEHLDSSVLDSYRAAIRSRAAGTPVSYIRRRKEFFGLEFFVDQRVLVPRPDTETLVEAALELLRTEGGSRRVHDLCTGSGCVAIALARECADHDLEIAVSASDISEEALDVFRINSLAILGVELIHYRSDLLAEVPGAFDMIVSNPPYLTTRETDGLSRGGWPEPTLALDGGEDGLALPRRLIATAPQALSPGGYLLLEAAPDQMDRLGEILAAKGFEGVEVRRDLAGRRRVVVGRRRP